MTQDTNGFLLLISALNFFGLLWLGLRAERRGAIEAAFATRVALIEQNFTNAPTHRDLQVLMAQINAISNQVAGISERLAVNTQMTQTIQKHLMEEEK